ncbi:hypothetical protein HYPSUDRAFT_919542 [Hypholoma sublateritium FD-334 SS-4]|uniref:ATPase AAA-type core domain-containing protein n=1 Tax=Hypholoma sublateritium (strain FD-334 SS-4) TaxID=945553 RepID=A0A0D2NIB4_HYPSF|nr:hypothetical protein HYPSUDRAFT_919542 [Hypholoma sublateritium FD-334 SS-4]
MLVVNGPELSSVYRAETEVKKRGVFDQARAQAPCIVVLDEVDAPVPRRDDARAEVEKPVIATLLTILDGMRVSLLRSVIPRGSTVTSSSAPRTQAARLDICNVLPKILHAISQDDLRALSTYARVRRRGHQCRRARGDRLCNQGRLAHRARARGHRQYADNRAQVPGCGDIRGAPF